jgi:FkbM family methyltransferase
MNLKSTLRKLAPRTVRPHRILSGPLRGRIIVTSFHDYPAAILGRTETSLLAWFRKNVKPGETWLDVGAHYGYTAIALAELVGQAGRVYAFEPSLTTAGYLNQTRSLNGLDQITVVPFGLGGPGDIRLTHVPIERGMANHGLGGEDPEDIYLIGFDHLWTSLGERSVHGVKIDVQGMELQVLRGMARTLGHYHPKLVVEFHSGVERGWIRALLRDAGYRLPAIPIEPASTERKATYHDDRSYIFTPAPITETLDVGAQPG